MEEDTGMSEKSNIQFRSMVIIRIRTASSFLPRTPKWQFSGGSHRKRCKPVLEWKKVVRNSHFYPVPHSLPHHADEPDSLRKATSTLSHNRNPNELSVTSVCGHRSLEDFSRERPRDGRCCLPAHAMRGLSQCPLDGWRSPGWWLRRFQKQWTVGRTMAASRL